MLRVRVDKIERELGCPRLEILARLRNTLLRGSSERKCRHEAIIDRSRCVNAGAQALDSPGKICLRPRRSAVETLQKISLASLRDLCEQEQSGRVVGSPGGNAPGFLLHGYKPPPRVRAILRTRSPSVRALNLVQRFQNTNHISCHSGARPAGPRDRNP